MGTFPTVIVLVGRLFGRVTSSQYFSAITNVLRRVAVQRDDDFNVACVLNDVTHAKTLKNTKISDLILMIWNNGNKFQWATKTELSSMNGGI